jgi:hypothetical protein
MLDDISAVKTWDKVNSGMIKMFTAEVLGRLPVVQHFLFGSILPPPPTLEDAGEDVEVVYHGDHSHVKQKKTVGDVKGEMFGDCCGIPVPVSSITSAPSAAYALPNADSRSSVCVRRRSGCAQERQVGSGERDHCPRTQSRARAGTDAGRLAAAMHGVPHLTHPASRRLSVRV